MFLNLEALTLIYPEQIWCALTDADLQKVQLKVSAENYSNATASNNAYLNHLCLEAFLNWLATNQEVTEPIVILPEASELPSIWEVVNGTALAIGDTKLVLIPDDSLDTESFTIPQEWVDIPEWIADYYLAVQVNWEQQLVNIWGYTTHAIIKHKADYDPCTQSYILERDDLISDLDIIWVAREIGSETKTVVEPLENLNVELAENLIVKLSQPSPFSPRLELEFSQWGALLAKKQWRQKLYQQRLQLAQSHDFNLGTIATSIINVGLWLRDEIDAIAQQLDWVLLPAFVPEAIPLRSPTQELEVIITQLEQQGLLIPITARGAYQDVEWEETPLRFYAVTWSQLSAEQEREWSLLLILGTPAGYSLPEGISMQIRDEMQILVERTFSQDSGSTHLYACVTGTWEECFYTTIALAKGTILNLPAFSFRPESE